jgi:hypothetical protein
MADAPTRLEAGTSTNMNANEVIANRALELMGHSRWSASKGSRRTQTCAGTTSTTASAR